MENNVKNGNDFVKNATEILKDYGLTEKQADAIANLTVLLERSKVCRESSLYNE